MTPFSEPQTSLGSISDTEGTRFLVEPTMMAYTDPHQTISPFLQLALNQPPLARLLDDESVEHSLHAITDEAAIEAIAAFFRSRPLLALDSTGWSNSSHRLVVLLDSADPGLFASPVHRVYRGPRNVDPAKLEALLAIDFQCEHLSWAGGDAAAALLASCATDQHAFNSAICFSSLGLV